jgi:hypothetical protein
MKTANQQITVKGIKRSFGIKSQAALNSFHIKKLLFNFDSTWNG